MVPTPRLLVVLLAIAPLAILPLALEPAWIALAIAWVAVAVAVGIDLALLASARLDIALQRPASAGVGRTVRAKAAIDLRAAAPLHGTLRAIADAPLTASAPIAVRIPRGASELPIDLHADSRGTGTLREIWLRLSGPLGLVARIEKADRGAGPIAVVPDVEHVDRTTMAVLGAQPMLSGLKREKWTGEGGEFESLQQYTLGMDLGSVDWKASARHQQLRVRRFHVERRQRIVVCLDVGRAMRDPIADTAPSESKRGWGPARSVWGGGTRSGSAGRGEGSSKTPPENARDPIQGLERLDHGVHTALVLAKAALRAGDLVGMHGYGGEPRAWVPPRSGVGQFARLRQAAAALRAETDETNHVLGLHDLLRRLSRRTMVVVFTEFSDATTAELMLDALGQLARKHVIVFVALDDPLLEEPLSTLPSDASDLAAAVVASNLAQRRHLVLARLPRLGVHVVHSRPGAVAADLVERYVNIKARGLIG
ncbi:DUF58 domain-containing protein [Sandaracinus amylolyticus]|uniref:DUF58 domain-containing protein n=1 Tax=Sandaracinus amylolyticus TaxID=927083 RepID=UPI001F44579C|nr:DUF58 domain-containing protein [Sandaracinus amylolyticus]UJR86245.1 Hypothetical protein I5071_83270 [Sandaracinus amylolyticus]